VAENGATKQSVVLYCAHVRDPYSTAGHNEATKVHDQDDDG